MDDMGAGSSGFGRVQTRRLQPFERPKATEAKKLLAETRMKQYNKERKARR